MADQTLAAKIAQAWNFRRTGQTSNAVNAFADLLKSHPNDVDTLYGMGLAQRSAGQRAEAVQSFQKALTLLENQRPDGLKIEERDRLMMLMRMTKQRISELT